VSQPTVSADKVVFFHYTLTDAAGEKIDSSLGREPVPYLHGAGNIVPGLEKRLEGAAVGDKIQAEVAPEEGYGTRDPDWPQPVERSQFPDDVELQVGMAFVAQGPEGQRLQMRIVALDETTVMVDANHPLADMTLHFDVEIVSIRDATDEEKQHGHPHMPGMPSC